MKLTFERSKLLRPLTLAVAMENSASRGVEAFRHLRITATDTIAIAAANLAGHLEIDAVGTIVQPGVVCAPARELHALVKSLPEGCDLELELKDQKLHIRAGRGKYRLPTFPADGWTERSKFKAEVKFEIASSALLQAMSEVDFAVASNAPSDRPWASGVCLSADMNGAVPSIAAVATDGHRIAYTLMLDNAPTGWPKVDPILPKEQLAVLSRLVSDVEVVKIGLSGGNIGISGSGFRFRGSVMVDEFPKWRAAVPANTSRIEFAHADMDGALKRLMTLIEQEAFEDDKGVRIRSRSAVFHFLESSITMDGRGNDGREASEEIDSTRTGGDLRVGMNLVMFVELLNSFRCKRLACLYSDDPAMPLVFMDAEFASVKEADRFTVQVTQRL